MRFLHTADWHLGRLFHQVHLTEDQDHVLRQFIDVARDARVDAVVVAGDVYDRAVPPPEAVRLLDDVLAELLLRVKVPVIVAAGNHDSPERLSFGARVVSAQGLHLFGLPSADAKPVVLADQTAPSLFTWRRTPSPRWSGSGWMTLPRSTTTARWAPSSPECSPRIPPMAARSSSATRSFREERAATRSARSQ